MVPDEFCIEDGILKEYRGAAPHVQVPDGVHTIGDGAFKGMAWLLSVELPKSLKRIGATAFKGCRQLKDISFPEGLEEIGEYAFHRCHGLQELILPDTVTLVGQCAFLYCDKLQKAIIQGPKSLGKGVFSHNLSLRELYISSEMDGSNFGDEVFEGCVCLHRIALSGVVYEVDNLVGIMDSHSGYPALIKDIAKSVFHSMHIEDGVLKAFSVNLKSITLPEGITAIGKASFFDKKGVVSLTLPKSIKSIMSNAFLNCISLEEITFRSECVELDDKAFRGCNNLKRIHLNKATYSLEEISDNEFINSIRDQVLGDFYISGNILVRYMGNEERIRIPDEVEIIGERCFFGKEQLKTVLCPAGLKEIREQAFAGCLTLQSIALPKGLRRVEREAFAECKKLMKCALPDTVEYIGEYAFRRCFSLRPEEALPENAQIHPYAFYMAKQFDEVSQRLRATVPAADVELRVRAEGEYIEPYAFSGKEDLKALILTGVKRIGKYAFSSCPNLEEITIDAPGCVLEQNVFSTCPKLKRVSLRVKEMGKAAFSYCRELSEVHLRGVGVLPAQCFAGCHSLQVFDAQEITRMEERCFDECIRLNSFDFTDIKRIGERAFERCDSLKSVEIADTEIGYHAFADCAGLESVSLTEKTVPGSGAFRGCTQIREIKYNGERYEFSRFADSLNHVGNPYPMRVREVIASIYSCFDIVEKRKLCGYFGDATCISIPEDVEEIAQDVFRDHVRLSDIRIPQSVKTIGSHAFFMTAWIEESRKRTGTVTVNGIMIDGSACSGRVVLPSDIRRVASWCFAGNIKITELVIPNDRIGIENLAFRNCLNLKRITDCDAGTYELKDVSDLKDEAIPENIRRIFTECINCFKLDAQGNLVESTGNITDLVFPDGIRSISDEVYKDCHLLETIALSGDTKSIGRSAFENSKWLRSVSGAGAVESIGIRAFSGCQSMESIDLSDRLKIVGARCFEHCCSLKEIHISNGLETIPERAFFRCKSLTRIYIPASVKVIETEAFAFCDELEEVYVSEKTQIADRAFAYCDKAKINIYGAGNATPEENRQ